MSFLKKRIFLNEFSPSCDFRVVDVNMKPVQTCNYLGSFIIHDSNPKVCISLVQKQCRKEMDVTFHPLGYHRTC